MNVLIWGSSETSPEMRHEVPVSIGDPFLYLETDGRRVVTSRWRSPTGCGRRGSR